MAVVLDTPITTSYEIASIKIKSFAIDIEDSQMYVTYAERDINNIEMKEHTILIEGQDYIDAITKSVMLCGGADIYGGLKGALYEQIHKADGFTGTEV